MKTARLLSLIFGLCMIVTGLYCVATPTQTFMMLGWLVGFSMLFDAIGRLVFWWEARKEGMADGLTLASAILSGVFAVLVLSSETLQIGIDLYIAYFIAIWLVANSIITIARAWKVRKFHKNWNTQLIGTHWYLPLAIGILQCLFGMLCVMNPQIVTATVGIFMGLGVVASGANIISVATTPID